MTHWSWCKAAGVTLYKPEAAPSFSRAINLCISMSAGQTTMALSCLRARQAARTWEGKQTPNSQEINGILWVKLGSTGEAPTGRDGDKNRGGVRLKRGLDI